MARAFALSLILFYCLLSSVFYRVFAEINIRFASIDLPIFISELLLAFAFGITLFLNIKQVFSKPYAKKLIILAFIVFVLWKAFKGYLDFGTLSFRNAALFYYSFFGIISYHLYNKKYFSQLIIIIIVLVSVIMKSVFAITPYYLFLFVMLGIALSLKSENKVIRILLILCALIIPRQYHESVFGFAFFFEGGRGRVLGHIISLISLTTFLFPLLIKNKIRRIVMILVVILSIFSAFIIFADKSSIISMISVKKCFSGYLALKEEIKAKEGDFVFQNLTTKLFNKSVEDARVSSGSSNLIIEGMDVKKEITDRLVSNLNIAQDFDKIDNQYRNLGTAFSNIYFRIFIWQDMIKELINEKAWFGVSFGKPQRSKSIEILDWATSEWKRDGWITPHNSFLHMIYRAGIVGLLFVIFIFSTVFKLIKTFIFYKDYTGIFIMSIFVYWLTISNFLVFLEFPYNAIPFWTLLGLTIAYSEDLKNKKGVILENGIKK